MTSKYVLVTYGSTRQGTAEIAQVVADALRQDGCTVDCTPADEVASLAGYDAVVIGGALYMTRWHRAARRFIREHEAHLRELPVWLFSSGPLDGTAAEQTIPPTRQVAQLMERIGARGHVTFGGRLAPDAKGLVATAMAKQHAGDFRDWGQIRAWGCEIACAIEMAEPVAARVATPPVRWPLVALCAFVAVTAIAGGALLVARPDGALLRAPSSMLVTSGFSTFLVPGLLLLAIIGLGNAAATLLLARHRETLGTLAAFAGGTALTVWIVTEMALLRTVHWLQIGYFALGIAITVLAFRAARLAAIASEDRSSAFAA